MLFMALQHHIKTIHISKKTLLQVLDYGRKMQEKAKVCTALFSQQSFINKGLSW